METNRSFLRIEKSVVPYGDTVYFFSQGPKKKLFQNVSGGVKHVPTIKVDPQDKKP